MAAEPEDKVAPPSAQEIRREWRLLRRTLNTLRTYFSRLLQVSPKRKPEIYIDMFRASEILDLNYWLEIFFSIGIATLGLIINSPAVVIGAMLISPLMGPIFGNGLSLALGDFYLGFKSLLNIILSTFASIFLAAFITWILPFRTPTPEILARVQPTLLDLGVAVLSGLAGAIVACRGGKGGGVTALPGVAVAVALMPPLGVIGFGIGSGWNWAIIRGGGLLFLTNLVAIILSSFLVFFSVRLDTPDVRRQINEWLDEHQKDESLYEFIDRTPLRRLLGRVGSLPKRVLILLIFLGTVAFPLQSTLTRLREEAQIRHVVFEEVHEMIPRDSIFSENLEIQPSLVRLRVVAVMPGGFTGEQRRSLEELIQARTNRPARVTVFAVATREDVSQLANRVSAPSPSAIETVDELRAKLLARIQPAVVASWPTEQAPLLSFEVTFEAEASPRLRIAYLADEDLGELGSEAVRKALRDRLGTMTLETQFERVPAKFQLAFRIDRDALSEEARLTLDQLASALAEFPRARCNVVLPSPEGTEPSEMSRKRGEVVRKYLTEEKKTALERISVTQGPGEPNAITIRILPPSQLQ